MLPTDLDSTFVEVIATTSDIFCTVISNLKKTEKKGEKEYGREERR